MASADRGGLVVDPMDTTYFTSRENVQGGRGRGMAFWRDKIFGVMHRNAAPASGYFHIPPGQLMEVGSQVRI
jgi:KUP system potassium uptake protein